MTIKVAYLDPNRGERILAKEDIDALNLALTQGTIDGVVIGSTTPAAGAFTFAAVSAAAGLTATGTTRANALQLAAAINVLGTVAVSTGAVLPAGVQVGASVDVYNDGANAAQIYALGSQTIDGTAGATGVALTNAKRCRYTLVATDTWVSAQLGVVSA